MKGYNNVFERIKRGQGSTIIKTSSKIDTRPFYHNQDISMPENDFLFLTPQKKQFLVN